MFGEPAQTISLDVQTVKEFDIKATLPALKTENFQQDPAAIRVVLKNAAELNITWPPGPNGSKQQFHYINMAELVERLMHDSQDVTEIIREKLDPIFSVAFNQKFTDVADCSMRLDEIRVVLNEDYSGDDIAMLRFHRGHIKPNDEQDGTVAEADIFTIKKCYFFIQNDTVVALDFSNDRKMGHTVLTIANQSRDNPKLAGYLVISGR